MLSMYQLRIFVAVAENRKFSLAAEQMHLTQPAVSQQIRSLEKYLGIALFQRNGQKVELTEAGLALLPRARELIELAVTMEEQIQDSRGILTGRIVLGTSPDAGKYILPRLAVFFKKRYPQVQTAVVVMDSDQLMARILGREVDFGVVAGKPRERALTVYPFAVDELVLIVSGKYALVKKDSFSLTELCQIPMVLQSDDGGICKAIGAAMAKRGLPLDALNVVLEVDNVEAAEVAVEAGAGAALVSRWALQRFAGRVKILQMEEPLRQDLYLVSRRRTAQSPAQQRFVEFLESPQGKQILELA